MYYSLMEEKSLTQVYHVGDLEGERTKPYYSQEGCGLSVSLHPDVWRRIASGVGGQTYELVNEGGVFFEADPSEPKNTVREYCINNGYAEVVEGWKAAWFDVEFSEERFSLGYDRERLERNTEVHEKEQGSIERTTVLQLAEKGRQYWDRAFRCDSPNPHQIESLLPVWYAQDDDRYDGVWWPHELSPSKYSAPKGVIFQSAVDDWECTICDFSQ